MSGDQLASNPLPGTSGINEKPNSLKDKAKTDVDAKAKADASVGANASNPNDEYLKISIVNSVLSNEVQYLLKKKMPLIRLKRSYSTKFSINIDWLCFMYHGSELMDYDTPEELNMINGDVIEIHLESNEGRDLVLCA